MADLFCGTGGWGGPKPGDPSNNSVLRAVPAFGGVDVSWTYPDLNPFAVAHTIIYRGTSAFFNLAVRHVTVSGDFFYDKTTTAAPIEYFYWIQFVSIHGTYGDVIGPASAIAKPTIEDMMVLLTGKIDAGVLATSLKGEIARIPVLEEGLSQEAEYRRNDYQTTAEAFQGLQATFDETVAVVLTEVETRASADSVLAQQITTVQSSLGEDLASVQVTLQTNIDTVGGKVTEIGALYTAKVSVNGLVGGFGIYNDGTEVEAGFDVDRFWIGRTQANKRKPFIIEGGVVYIDEAAINKLTFSKLRDESGSFVVEGGRVKAQYLKVATASIDDLAVTNAKIGGDIYSKNWSGWGGAGWLISQAGIAYLNEAHIRGTLYAANGTFSGTLTAQAINAVGTINIAGQSVTVSTFNWVSTGNLHPGNLPTFLPGTTVWSTSVYCPVDSIISVNGLDSLRETYSIDGGVSRYMFADGIAFSQANFTQLGAGWHTISIILVNNGQSGGNGVVGNLSGSLVFQMFFR